MDGDLGILHETPSQENWAQRVVDTEATIYKI